MAILSILEYPDKRLRNKALPVSEVDSNVRRIVDDMFETMYEQSNTVGLASIQVNIPLRILVMDISEDRSSPICVINPEIIAREGIQQEVEGCVSFPGVWDKVDRSAKICMRALDQNGKPYELNAEELLSVCIQHEMDHLDGVLFVDHLSRLKQTRLVKKLQKNRLRAVE